MMLRLAMVMIPGKIMAVNKLARKLICLLSFVMNRQPFIIAHVSLDFFFLGVVN